MSMEFDADTVSAPRLIVMKRGEAGYGFNLHGERNVQAGQTISAVDDGSEAQRAGLRVGDKVVEVNGANVEKTSHSDVVKRIKMIEKEVTMLVIDHVTEAYLKQEGRPITADMANLMTVYQAKEVASEPEAPQPEVQESNVVESAPPPTESPAAEITNDSAAEEHETTTEAEIANEATTPEEVKQLNEVLDKEDSSPPSEPTPASQTNGTESHPEPEPEPVKPAPTPVEPVAAAPPPQKPVQPAKPTAKPLRSTIKQQKTESWDEKYKKFQQL